MSGVPTTTGIGGLESAIPLVTRGDGRDTAGRLDWFLGLDARTGVLVADLQDNVDGSNHPVTGSTVLEDGTWYHVAATYDGTTWRLYLNGRLEAERATGEILPETSGTAPVGLGTAISGDGSVARGSFDGVLDETRIWSTARSATEIRHDLNRPVAADAPHLVAAWSMDEGGGTTLADGSDGPPRCEPRRRAGLDRQPAPGRHDPGRSGFPRGRRRGDHRGPGLVGGRRPRPGRLQRLPERDQPGRHRR